VKDYSECITAAHNHLRDSYEAASLGRMAEALQAAFWAQDAVGELVRALEAERLRRDREKRGIAT
jgi:hypothetical protein